jgi:hypothetical protein
MGLPRIAVLGMGLALMEGLGGGCSMPGFGPVTDSSWDLGPGPANPRERVLMSRFLPPVARFSGISTVGVLISG